MIVTVDTNVMYQALYSQKGAAHYILGLIRRREIVLALSVSVYEEYQDVLLRPKSLEAFGLTAEDVQKFLTFIAFIGKPHTIYYRWRPNLRDENDNMFIELAVASQSNWLITSNIRDFTVNNELRHDGFTIGTPSQFVVYWKKGKENNV